MSRPGHRQPLQDVSNAAVPTSIHHNLKPYDTYILYPQHGEAEWNDTPQRLEASEPSSYLNDGHHQSLPAHRHDAYHHAHAGYYNTLDHRHENAYQPCELQTVGKLSKQDGSRQNVAGKPGLDMHHFRRPVHDMPDQLQYTSTSTNWCRASSNTQKSNLETSQELDSRQMPNLRLYQHSRQPAPRIHVHAMVQDVEYSQDVHDQLTDSSLYMVNHAEPNDSDIEDDALFDGTDSETDEPEPCTNEDFSDTAFFRSHVSSVCVQQPVQETQCNEDEVHDAVIKSAQAPAFRFGFLSVLFGILNGTSPLQSQVRQVQYNSEANAAAAAFASHAIHVGSHDSPEGRAANDYIDHCKQAESIQGTSHSEFTTHCGPSITSPHGDGINGGSLKRPGTIMHDWGCIVEPQAKKAHLSPTFHAPPHNHKGSTTAGSFSTQSERSQCQEFGCTQLANLALDGSMQYCVAHGYQHGKAPSFTGCSHSGCDKLAHKSKDGQQQFCFVHMRAHGLEPLAGWCQHPGCKGVAVLAEDGLQLHCRAHTIDSGLDLAQPPQCLHSGCKKAARLDDNGQYSYCTQHAFEYGVQPRFVCHHPGCRKDAQLSTTRQRFYCREHMDLVGITPATLPSCQHPGCSNRAKHGGTGLYIYCQEHAPEHTTQPPPPRCQHASCPHLAVLSADGSRSYCLMHLWNHGLFPVGAEPKRNGCCHYSKCTAPAVLSTRGCTIFCVSHMLHHGLVPKARLCSWPGCVNSCTVTKGAQQSLCQLHLRSGTGSDMCQHPGCSNQALPLPETSVWYCKQHAWEYGVDAHKYRCDYPGCASARLPSKDFILEYCVQHIAEHKHGHKDCVFPGCRHRAMSAQGGVRVYCASHCLQMNVKLSQQCLHGNCSKGRVTSSDGTRLYCVQHMRLQGLTPRTKASSSCQALRCQKPATSSGFCPQHQLVAAADPNGCGSSVHLERTSQRTPELVTRPRDLSSAIQTPALNHQPPAQRPMSSIKSSYMYPSSNRSAPAASHGQRGLELSGSPRLRDTSDYDDWSMAMEMRNGHAMQPPTPTLEDEVQYENDSEPQMYHYSYAQQHHEMNQPLHDPYMANEDASHYRYEAWDHGPPPGLPELGLDDMVMKHPEHGMASDPMMQHDMYMHADLAQNMHVQGNGNMWGYSRLQK